MSHNSGSSGPSIKSNELAACRTTVAVADPQLFARGLEYKP